MASVPLLPTTAPFAEDQIAAFNKAIASTTAEQRAWLSGFLAGYQAASGPSAAPAPAAAPVAKVPLTILYGTESGNAEALALQARKAAAKLGFAATVLDMAATDPAAIAQARNLVVIASTWGEGDPPERATDFHQALMADDAPRMDGVRFAVLALGDMAYVNFCAVGKRIDARLEALGAQRVAARVDCDVDYERPAAGWIKGALDEIKAKATEAGPAGGAVIHVDFAHGEPDAALDAAAYDKTNPFEAEITEWINLNGSRSSKETIHVELSLAGSGIPYEPGDSLGILPLNDPDLVEAIQAAVGLGGDDMVRHALTERHDVTTLTRPLVQSYAELTGDAALTALLDGDALRRFSEGRQVIDLFETYPHRLSAEQLTGLLRPLPPRLYSIASSRKAVPDEAHLLLAAVRYHTHGRDRKGVASTFVADRRRVGERMKVYLKPNRYFRLPADADAPVIMIGPGTGIAPFRAFLQEREAQGAPGRNWLFFGDRNFQHDFLYQLEWQDMLKDGVLTRLDLAFSRDQPEKIYVQDRLWQARADLHAWLEEGAHLYVCGDEKAMAKDVHATLARIVAEQSGKGPEAAEAYLADLRRNGRYLRDVY